MHPRLHISKLSSGTMILAADQAHHIINVLRLGTGETIELFDSAGQVASAVITQIGAYGVTLVVQEPEKSANQSAIDLTVAAALPKGDRADWMIEKLSELGVAHFIPLAAARSVVLPAGQNKLDRWRRIAVESAKQSRRSGVMEIAGLTDLSKAVAETPKGLCLSTQDSAPPLTAWLAQNPIKQMTLFIGPEGGWTDDELSKMNSAGFAALGLTSTVLRVETAAVTAAGVVMCLR